VHAIRFLDAQPNAGGAEHQSREAAAKSGCLEPVHAKPRADRGFHRLLLRHRESARRQRTALDRTRLDERRERMRHSVRIGDEVVKWSRVIKQTGVTIEE